jgi:orotate phosphoribosyltransferase
MNKNVGCSDDALNGFLRRLHERGAVKIDTVGGFKLKLHEKDPTAPLSPLYFNLRVASNKGGPLIGSDVQDIASFFYAYLTSNNIQFGAICPVPNAGDPFAIALQAIILEREGRDVPLFELEKIVEVEGRRMGELKPTPYTPVGMVVLVIDDLISRADSKIEAVESLRRAGCIVNDALVFLDREQGGTAGMQKLGVQLHSIVAVGAVLETYRDMNLITPEQHYIITSYLQHAQ